MTSRPVAPKQSSANRSGGSAASRGDASAGCGSGAEVANVGIMMSSTGTWRAADRQEPAGYRVPPRAPTPHPARVVDAHGTPGIRPYDPWPPQVEVGAGGPTVP